MLAPSVERELGAFHDFAAAARDLYPGYAAALSERTGLPVPLDDRGILELAASERRAEALRRGLEHPSEWLESTVLRTLEPALPADAAGAVLHPRDGAVDPLALMDALRAAVARHERIRVTRENVRAVGFGPGGAVVETDAEERVGAGVVIAAAGAWTPLIEGIPSLPVAPARGQMIALRAAPLRHVVYAEHGYLVPRGEHTAVGATMEHAGFAATTTEDGIATLRAAAALACPELASAAVAAAWAGLRPMTPDFLPIICRDPDEPRLVYACGHSRNGILLTPATALIVADIVTGVAPRAEHAPVLQRFRADRFSG